MVSSDADTTILSSLHSCREEGSCIERRKKGHNTVVTVYTATMQYNPALHALCVYIILFLMLACFIYSTILYTYCVYMENMTLCIGHYSYYRRRKKPIQK